MSITFEKLGHEYNKDSIFSYVALKDVDLEIKEGIVTAVIGETGSGKSTLVQHLNALLLPTSGKLHIKGRTIESNQKPKQIKSLRKEVGLVFQFPEYQLFEKTIEEDVCFGPLNFNVPEEEAKKKAIEALKLVGLDESYLGKSPFDLSGGQKRRVAIAGILAMDPDILVLDEPTAGLDPQGAKDMMDLFIRLNKEFNKTVLIVTHDMEHVLNYCDEVVVVKDGNIHKQCEVNEFFQSTEILKELRINPPAIIRLREELIENGFSIPVTVTDIKTLASIVANEVKKYE